MGTTRQPVIRVPQGSTATWIRAEIVDSTGNAVDVSAGTSILFYASTPDGTAVVSGDAAEYVSDGSDGQVQFLSTEALVGTPRDLYCEFEIQGVNGVVNRNEVTHRFTLQIVPRAKVGA